MNKPVILFDLDGTISDPIEGIWRSLNYALEYYGYEPCSRELSSAYIGPPLDEIVATLTGDDHPEHVLNVVNKYRERFSRVGYSENSLYPGIREALSCLAEQGFPLGICTSKRADFAEKIVRMFQLDEFFEFISGGDIGIKKSQQISSLLRDEKIDKRSLMVGDRAVDVRAAHENNIRSAGVLWGYGSRAELEAEAPDYLLENISDIPEMLR